MKKNVITLLLFAFFLVCPEAAAFAAPLDELIDRQLSALELNRIETFWQTVVDQYGGYLPEVEQKSFYEWLKEEENVSISEYVRAFLSFLFYEIAVHGKLLGTIVLLTVFSVILQYMQNAFEQRTVARVGYAIVYMVMVLLALNSFHVAISYTEEAIRQMMNFLIALIPLLLALTASVGGVTTVAFFHPFIIFLINASGFLISHIVLPLIFLSALLFIVSTLTEHYKVTQLAKLLRNIGIGALAFFFAVFLGVISVQGAATAVTDGIAIRTAKFITGNFIPVIGRMFTDATDTVLSASVLLKNTIGIAGMLILLFIVAFPALKVLALALIYNVAAAVLQPLGGGPVIECLTMIAKTMLYIFAALAVMSFMFFLAVAMIIAAGNLSLMVR